MSHPQMQRIGHPIYHESPVMRCRSIMPYAGFVWVWFVVGIAVCVIFPLLSYGQAADSEATDGDSERVGMFDGQTLQGWHGVPEDRKGDWSVRDGAIVGEGSVDGLAYLVWQETELADFELELQYRIPDKGNSGIEIRAQPDSSRRRPFIGYHADLGHIGIGTRILGAWDFHFDGTRKEHDCHRGTRLTIGPNDESQVTPVPGSITEGEIRDRDWNHVRIVAIGNHCTFFINGKPASEFSDDLKQGQLHQGAIGLQIHDKGMRVEFKDLYIKKLKNRSN